MSGSLIGITPAMAAAFGIRKWPGYETPFTRQQYAGAKFPNETRVKKARENTVGDFTPLGSIGTVLGSIGNPVIGAAYFVAWDHAPKRPTFVAEEKIEDAP